MISKAIDGKRFATFERARAYIERDGATEYFLCRRMQPRDLALIEDCEGNPARVAYMRHSATMPDSVAMLVIEDACMFPIGYIITHADYVVAYRDDNQTVSA